jgi:hypothetical protein
MSRCAIVVTIRFFDKKHGQNVDNLAKSCKLAASNTTFSASNATFQNNQTKKIK